MENLSLVQYSLAQHSVVLKLSVGRACGRKEVSYVTGKILLAKDHADLVSRLYWEAQSQHIPMTKLVDQIVAEGLARYRARRSCKNRTSAIEEQLFFDFGVQNKTPSTFL